MFTQRKILLGVICCFACAAVIAACNTTANLNLPGAATPALTPNAGGGEAAPDATTPTLGAPDVSQGRINAARLINPGSTVYVDVLQFTGAPQDRRGRRRKLH